VSIAIALTQNPSARLPDGVADRRSVDDRGQHRLRSGHLDRQRDAPDEREDEHVRVLDEAGRREDGQQQRHPRVDEIACGQEDLPVHPVHEHARECREEECREAGDRPGEPEQRLRVRELEDQPALGGLLHERAHGEDDRGQEESPEVPRRERREGGHDPAGRAIVDRPLLGWHGCAPRRVRRRRQPGSGRRAGPRARP
jgi:hypothetical protein